MRIICLDDHPTMLDSLVRELDAIVPGTTISAFQDASTALEYAEENGCDVLFCEIDLYGNDGLLFAEKMQAINPRVNIIFTTVCAEAERAKEVFRLHPSGYITKPYTREQLASELDNLRYPVSVAISVKETPETAPAVDVGNEKREMDRKKLRRLRRSDLLELLIAQTKETESLKAKLEEAEQKLADRNLAIKKYGSIAQASLQLNGVFEAAQRAADQYLVNIQMQTQQIASQEKEAVVRAERLLEETQSKCAALESETARKCEEMTRKAEAETELRWKDLQEKLDAYIREHETLCLLLNSYKK